MYEYLINIGLHIKCDLIYRVQGSKVPNTHFQSATRPDQCGQKYTPSKKYFIQKSMYYKNIWYYKSAYDFKKRSKAVGWPKYTIKLKNVIRIV